MIVCSLTIGLSCIKGAEIDEQNNNGMTALMEAIISNNTEAVRVLLVEGVQSKGKHPGNVEWIR